MSQADCRCIWTDRQTIGAADIDEGVVHPQLPFVIQPWGGPKILGQVTGLNAI